MPNRSNDQISLYVCLSELAQDNVDIYAPPRIGHIVKWASVLGSLRHINTYNGNPI